MKSAVWDHHNQSQPTMWILGPLTKEKDDVPDDPGLHLGGLHTNGRAWKSDISVRQRESSDGHIKTRSVLSNSGGEVWYGWIKVSFIGNELNDNTNGVNASESL